MEELEHRIAPAHIYVDADATGGGSGVDWSNAYTDVQLALADAAGNVDPTDEIWVAEGTYRPTTGADRSATFQLLSGVALYGGFDGTEGLRTERDWETHVTVLSGDLNGDDVGFTNNGENAYNILKGEDNAILDGFTVTGGNADGGALNDIGAGMLNFSCSPTVANCTFNGNAADSSGGGMYNSTSSPTLTNCTFSGNTADTGAGMDNYQSSPILMNCTFASNLASSFAGGGIYNSSSSSTTLTNCIFSGNTADYGGGIYIYASSPTLVNCVFSGNTADAFGGGVESSDSSPTLVNCTFTGNSADWGGAMYNSGSSSPTLTNCILWGNTAKFSGDEIDNSSGTPTIRYSDIEGCGGSGGGWDSLLGTDGGGNIDDDPMFFNASDPNGADNIFATFDDGLRPIPGSPVIDAGTGAGAPSTDVIGIARPAGGIDMGAYEAMPLSFVIDLDHSETNDTGWSQSDNITKVASPIYNVTLNANGTLRIDWDGDDTWDKTVALTPGTHQVSPDAPLTDGFYPVNVDFTVGGQVVTDSEPTTIDTVADAVPNPPDLQAASDSGILNDDNLTNDATPTFDVSGFSTYYRVYRDIVLAGGEYETGATWTSGLLGDGDYDFTVRSVDVAGNESADSAPVLTVTIDTAAPAVPAAPVLQAGSDTGIAGDGVTYDTTPTFDISGVGPTDYWCIYCGGAPVSAPPDLGDDGRVYRSGTSETLGVQPDGERVYTVRATDAAGNRSAHSPGLSVTVDTQAPRVVDLSPSPDGVGHHVTCIVARFDESLDPATVIVANFTLYSSGVDGIIGTGDDVQVFPVGAAYDDPSRTATFTFAAELPLDTYRVTLNGTSSFGDVAGNRLDGEPNAELPSGDGTPGGDFVADFVVADLTEIEVVAGQLWLYDMDAANPGEVDVAAGDVVVKLDKTGAVAAVTIVGNPTGLGILVNTSAAGLEVQIKDARNAKDVGPLNALSFFASGGPVKQLALKTGIDGANLNSLVLGGGTVTMDDDMDGDGSQGDRTALYSVDYVRTVKVLGGMGGDILVKGDDGKGCGLGKLDIRNGGVFGDVVTVDAGLKCLTITGGDQTGDVRVNGALGKATIKAVKDKLTGALAGGSLTGRVDVQTYLQGLSINGGDLDADIIAHGADARLNGIGAVVVKAMRNGAGTQVGGTVRGSITAEAGGMKSLAITGGDLLANVVLSGGLGSLMVKAVQDKTLPGLVGGAISGVDVLVSGELKKVSANEIRDNTLIAASAIGTVTVVQNLTHSHIHAGGTVDTNHNWTQGHGDIKSVTVKGNMEDTHITAGAWVGDDGLWGADDPACPASGVGPADQSVISKVSVGGSIIATGRYGILAATDILKVQAKADALSVTSDDLPLPDPPYDGYNGLLIAYGGGWETE